MATLQEALDKATNWGAIYNNMVGLPVGGLQLRQARETRDVLNTIVAGESDPEVRAQLQSAIDSNAFSQMTPSEAHRALIAMAEQRKAEKMNTVRDTSALKLLAAEIPDLPADLVAQFGLDPTKPTGQRTDELRAEIRARLGRGQTGLEQAQLGQAEVAAARSGLPVSEQDRTAISNRAATIAGRQRGTEFAGLRETEEARRERNLARLASTLSGTTYEAQQSNLGEATAKTGMTKYDYVAQLQKKNSGAGRVGVSLGGARELGGGVNNIGLVGGTTKKLKTPWGTWI